MIERRRFLWLVAGGAAAAAGVAWIFWRGSGSGGSGAEGEGKPSTTGAIDVDGPIPPNVGVFPERYRQTLRAMVARLYPESEGSPGAESMGAYDYLEKELRRADMQGVRRELTRGAVQLDRVSQQAHRKVYPSLTPAQQDEVIALLSRGEGAAGRFDPKAFVTLMVSLTLEGLFADPEHGGNRDGRGWKSIQYTLHAAPPYGAKPWMQHAGHEP